MATKQKTNKEIRQENVVENLSKTEQFYNKHEKLIWGIVIALLLVWLGSFGYQKWIYQPKCAEAQEQTYPAELNFQQGEYELALNGDGNVLGFRDIVDQYGNKAGKAVYLYAGICELQLGNYGEAIGYLKKYKGKDPILAARALSCQGDAYVGLEDYASAVKAFAAASKESDNVFSATYLFKEGQAHDKLGSKDEALRCYKSIKEDYPQSVEAYDIDRYIAAIGE